MPLSPADFAAVVPIPLEDGWPVEPERAVCPKTKGYRLSFVVDGDRRFAGHHYPTPDPVDEIVAGVRERIAKGRI